MNVIHAVTRLINMDVYILMFDGKIPMRVFKSKKTAELFIHTIVVDSNKYKVLSVKGVGFR